MREIEFRAKESFNDNWAYGSLIMRANYYTIFKEEFEINKDQTITFNETEKPVKAYTLGQYVGLKDKNGTKIFEGDIVELHDKISNIHWTAIIEFGNPNSGYTWGFQLKPLKILEPTGVKKVYWNTDILVWIEMEEVNISCEIIGNIYNNIELLKGESNDK